MLGFAPFVFSVQKRTTRTFGDEVISSFTFDSFAVIGGLGAIALGVAGIAVARSSQHGTAGKLKAALAALMLGLLHVFRGLDAL